MKVYDKSGIGGLPERFIPLWTFFFDHLGVARMVRTEGYFTQLP